VLSEFSSFLFSRRIVHTVALFVFKISFWFAGVRAKSLLSHVWWPALRFLSPVDGSLLKGVLALGVSDLNMFVGLLSLTYQFVHQFL
jgi:hypothetical protein